MKDDKDKTSEADLFASLSVQNLTRGSKAGRQTRRGKRNKRNSVWGRFGSSANICFKRRKIRHAKRGSLIPNFRKKHVSIESPRQTLKGSSLLDQSHYLRSQRPVALPSKTDTRLTERAV